MSSRSFHPEQGDMYAQSGANDRPLSAAPTTARPDHHVQPSQPPFYATPYPSLDAQHSYDAQRSQTFGCDSYPAWATGYSSTYPLPPSNYLPSAFQPQPTPWTAFTPQLTYQAVATDSMAYRLPQTFNPSDLSADMHGTPAYAPSFPAQSLPYTRPALIEGMFGNTLPTYVAMAGGSNAVNQLRQAINVEHLIVGVNTQSCHDTFATSLKHLQAKGAIADPEMTDIGKGRFTLDEMSWQERAKFNIKPDDFHIDPANSVQALGNPPFQGHIDRLLGLLRIMTKYHGYSHGATYQLGIITKTNSEDYEVQIFNAGESNDLSHIVWMYRECIGDYSVENRWIELWHPLVRRPDAPSRIQEAPDSDAFLFPLQHQDSNDYAHSLSNQNSASKPRQRKSTTRRGRAAKTARQVVTSATPSMSAAAPIPHGIPNRRNPPGAQHKQDNAHLFAHLTDEEVLSGAVHPEDIVGTLMLRLVPKYSNTELHERIVELYRRLNPANPKRIESCAVTKRWTLPVQWICKSQGKDRAQLMQHYHDLRRANGILGGTGGGDGPSPSTKRKDPSSKSEKKRARIKRENFLDIDAGFEEDDEEDFPLLPVAAPTRGRRTRKRVDYGVFDGAVDDFDEEETVRPAKRARTKVVEEDDGSEFEDEGD